MDYLIENISWLYQQLGVEREATMGDFFGLVILVSILLMALSFYFVASKRSSPPKEPKKLQENLQEEAPKQALKPDSAPITQEVDWKQKLKDGLSRSRQEVWGKIAGLMGQKKGIDSDTLEELEEVLYSADIGPKSVAAIIEGLEEIILDQGELDLLTIKNYLRTFLRDKLAPYQTDLDESLFDLRAKKVKDRPTVIMVVGVNGAGKTTTIGKLATKLTAQGAKVVVGACDTFRAAAVDQLQVWCDRSGAEMIRAKEGASPSGVGYQALEQAIKSKADYCILDTAGRLHTKDNLMQELAKSRDVLRKLIPEAPDHILLVIDAITGQNALRQAEEFHKTLQLTGLILTKCDGSSKAGSAVSIVQSLQVPITYIGVGEKVEDLDRFDLESYLDGLIGTERSEGEKSSTSISPSIDVNH